jgi:hypothetical protein
MSLAVQHPVSSRWLISWPAPGLLPEMRQTKVLLAAGGVGDSSTAL